MRRRARGGFVKLYRQTVDLVAPLPRGVPPDTRQERGERLTWHQLGILLALCAHIGRQDTIVRHDDGRGAPMTISDIADIMGCARQNASTTLRALERAGVVEIIGSTGARHVRIMPYVANRYSDGGPGAGPD